MDEQPQSVQVVIGRCVEGELPTVMNGVEVTPRTAAFVERNPRYYERSELRRLNAALPEETNV